MLKTRFTLCTAIAAAVVISLACDASAAMIDVDISPDVANTIRSDQPDSNFAPAPNAGQMIVGRLNTDRLFRGVLSFSLDDAPLTIEGASLTVAIENTATVGGTPTFELFALTETPVVDEVTWNNYDASNTWATPGGDFLATPLATAVGTGPYSQGDTFTFSSSALLAAIQAEAAGDGVLDLILRAPNFETDSGVNNIFRLSNGAPFTNEAGPVLNVTGIPEPSALGLMLGGLAAMAGVRRES